MTDHDFDPDRDAELRSLLREQVAPPFDQVDWHRLLARITADAEPLLARARSSAGRLRTGAQQAAWWQMLAAWSARGIPVAATAAAAAIVFIVTGSLERPRAVATADTYITLEEELAYGSAALTAAGNDSDAVLNALLFYEEASR